MFYINDKYCLKWNDYNKNITTSYSELRESFDFSDVTLMCDEDQQIEAHRIILSASSLEEQTLSPIDLHEGSESKGLSGNC